MKLRRWFSMQYMSTSGSWVTVEHSFGIIKDGHTWIITAYGNGKPGSLQDNQEFLCKSSLAHQEFATRKQALERLEDALQLDACD